MLRPHRSYGGDEGDYNDIALPTPKRRKIYTVEGTRLDNSNGTDALNTEKPISTGKNLPEFDETTYKYRASIYPSSSAQSISNGISARCSPAPATEAGDVVESSGKSQKICFGMLTESRMEILKPLKVAKHHMGPSERTANLSLRIRADAVTVLDADQEEFGVLDSKTTMVLKLVRQSHESLQMEPLMAKDDWDSGGKTRNYSLKIILYANEDSVEDIGAILSDHCLFLQEPAHLQLLHRYRNPHVLLRTDMASTPRYLRTAAETVRFARELEDILLGFSSTSVSVPLQQHNKIKTTLQGHQLAALQFMADREEGIVDGSALSLWKRRPSGEPGFIHKITEENQTTSSCKCRGGILADEMGMGKSLTLLALTMHTRGEGCWGRRWDQPLKPYEQKTNHWSGATLIVAPKSTLYNWVLQINNHLDPDTLSVHLYHGSGTNVGQEDISDKDIVLTTYETLYADMNGSKTLSKVSWFRIVLDEAHHIRNRSTKCFQAVMNLKAQRRWCLTGTPVQNGLDDLFSLLQFLRFHPFQTLPNARKYILEPLGRHDEKGLRNLRLTMGAISLRRGRRQTSSQHRNEKIVHVNLNVDERQRYSSILEEARHLARTTGKNRGKNILQSILALRQLCSHGSSRVPSSNLLFNNNNRYDTPLSRTQSVNCDNCDQSFSHPDKFEGAFNGSCGHKVCSECLNEQKNGQLLDSVATLSQCYVCQEPTVACDLTDMSSPDSDFDMEQDDPLPLVNVLSSKIETVLSNLIKLQERSREENGNEPIKSLVFSYFTKTLDTLGHALSNREMAFERIDGSLSLDQRSKAIGRFQDHSSIRIMLLSYGSGSVGLNLAAANHVHLIEPHWNPMLEAQAAARVDRLDQKKPIYIYRYVVKESIEERVQATQRRKIQLAELSNCPTNTSENSSSTEIIEGLEELIK